MQVYKFGGASISTPERMQALLPIIQNAKLPLTVIVSALGKVTNSLEIVVKTAIAGERAQAEALLNELEEQHIAYVNALFSDAEQVAILDKLKPYFIEILWAMDDAGVQSEDYVYDQIVCIGEMFSTIIFAAFLNKNKINTEWLDARDLLRTNEYYRNAIVDEVITTRQVQKVMLPLLQNGNVVVTQGFIGASSDNNSTTLGREGSDYSAALIASILEAESVTIWKDVPGFLNADPRKFADAVRIPEISYYEVIELAYYGAQIIHPKTIKPLQNNSIPLYVKCFLDPALEGSVIKKRVAIDAIYPPLIVHKGAQMLMKMTTKDFSFITEENLSKLYDIFAKHHVKINMIQNAAISFVCCIDAKHFALDELITDLNIEYDVMRNEDCTLLTVRHYQDAANVEKLVGDKKVILRQRSRKVYQVLYKDHKLS